MKRPLLLFSMFLIVGIFIAQFGSLPLFIMTLVLVMASLSIAYLHSKKNIIILLGMFLFFFAGAAEFTVINKINLDKFKEFSGEEVQVLGFVCTEPDVKEAKTVYTVRTDEIKTSGKNSKVKGKLLLTVPNKDGTPIFEYGMGLTINGKISIPDGKRIPGGFDYRRHLLKSGISATIYARGESVKIMDSSSVNPVVKIGMGLRKRIIGTIKSCLPKEQASLLSGMLIGFTEDMSDEMVDAFSDAGLSHLTAVPIIT